MFGQIPTGIRFPATDSSFFGPALPLFVLGLLYHVVVFAVVYRVLTRSDFDTQNKILWTLVAVFVPLGFVLYWMAAPAVPTVNLPHRAAPGRDVSGTPWAHKPGYTKPS